MKKLLLIFLFVYSGLNAQVFLDTLSSRYVGPGVIHTQIWAPTVPWRINVLRIDLKNPNISFQTVKAKDKYVGQEQVSQMVNRTSRDGHYVVGAVNADYFVVGTGEMVTIQVANGQILRGPGNTSVLGFDSNNKTMINIVNLDAKVFSGSNSFKITEFNQSRGTNQMILYNNFMVKDSTGTNSSGSEALITPVQSWIVNDTMVCVVESVVSGKGNMAIPAGKAVLSGNGTAATFITNNLHVGDTIKVFQGLKPGIARIKELTGGRPKLVSFGKNFVEDAIKGGEPGSSTYTREPRTGAGISADSTYLYLVTLDGITMLSAGATLSEFADVMIKIGIAHGLNLDGGSSSTMLVRGILSDVPSGGGVERPVGNSLMVISTAPSAPEALNSFSLTVHNKRVYVGEKLQLQALGNDKYFNPVDVSNSNVQFTVSPSLGTIDQSGLFTAVNKAASGYVYAKYNSYSDSVFIKVKTINQLKLNPGSVVVDGNKTFQFGIKCYDADNISRSPRPGEISWQSTNPSVATVDSNGVVSGKSEGKVKIIASYSAGISDTVEVNVQIGKGIAFLEQMEDSSKWSVSGSNIDLNSTTLNISADDKSQGAGSLKIDYKFTYDPAVSNMLYLDTDIPVYGVPDSLFIDTKTDTLAHKLSFILSNNDNAQFRVNARGYITANGKFTTIPVLMQNFAALGSGTFYYPARITRLEIQLQYNNSKKVAGQSYSGTIYLDNFRAKYPSGSTLVKDDKNFPKEFSLKQNYPNPFNPSTVIEFGTVGQENTTLKVYDLLGREVAVLVNGRLSEGMHKALWNAGSIASGIYFYRLQSGSFVETKKMMLVR